MMKKFYLALAATVLTTTSVFAMDPQTIGEELGYTRNAAGQWVPPADFSLPLMSRSFNTQPELEQILTPHHPGTMYNSVIINTSSGEMDKVDVPFTQVFAVHPYLETLSISKRTMGTFPGGNLRINEFVSGLHTSQINLKSLRIMSSGVDDEGVQLLAGYLQKNPPLQKLLLELNNITDKGALNLGEALKINTNLKELNLMGNKSITNAGLKSLGEALDVAGRTPQSPLELDLMATAVNLPDHIKQQVLAHLKTKNVNLIIH